MLSIIPPECTPEMMPCKSYKQWLLWRPPVDDTAQPIFNVRSDVTGPPAKGYDLTGVTST